MTDVLSAVLLVVGGAVMLLAGVGIVRMPDLFSRMQAATKASSLGVGCLVLAGAVHFGELAVAARAVLVIAFVFLTAPVAAQLIARSLRDRHAALGRDHHGRAARGHPPATARAGARARRGSGPEG